MGEGAFCGVDAGTGVSREIVRGGDQAPRAGEAQIVSAIGEHADRLFGGRDQLISGGCLVGEQTQQSTLHQRPRSKLLVIGLQGGAQDAVRPADVAGHSLNCTDVRDELDPLRVVRRQQCSGPGNEVDRRRSVFAQNRSTAGGAQPFGRDASQGFCRLVGGAELNPVAARLFEVVSDDLVDLDEIDAVPLEPQREPLVQIGSGRLG